MSRLHPFLSLTRHVGQTTCQYADCLAGSALAAALAVSITLALTGCSTPVAKPSLDLPATFAAATASEMEPEVAWWEAFNDPVLTDLVRRAMRENRDIELASERLCAARAGEAISRSWLFPSV